MKSRKKSGSHHLGWWTRQRAFIWTFFYVNVSLGFLLHLKGQLSTIQGGQTFYPPVISQFGGKSPIGTLPEANSSHLKTDDWKTTFFVGLSLCSVAMLVDLSVSGTVDVYIITVYCWALVLYDTWYSFPWSRSTHHGATVATSPAPPVVPNRPPPRPPAALASARTHEVAQPAGRQVMLSLWSLVS